MASSVGMEPPVWKVSFMFPASVHASVAGLPRRQCLNSAPMRGFPVCLTVLASLAFLAAQGTAAGAQPASPWVEEAGAQVRLVAGAPAEDGALSAGVEIKLAPGWKTYWINPGPTGIPPRLDFTASENVASAVPLWPAPVRFTDGSSHAIGYAGRF